MATTDRIEKQIVLQAPIARVWRALADTRQFGEWFRVKLEGEFQPGQWIRGQILHPGYEHLKFEVQVERIEPMRLFSFRGPAEAVPPGADPASVANTLVEFHLEEVPEGTKLTVIESGFASLPPERREEMYRGNLEGWSIQLENIRAYVSA